MPSRTPGGKPVLEIIPNTRFIVFHGDQHNAEPVKLSGVVRLTTSEAMSIKGVKIELEGKRRIAWFYMGGMAAGEVADKRTFFSESQTLGTSGTHKINKGVIEWPFEFELHGDMSESIEGMSSTWVVYNLIATVSRPGWNAKDLCRAVHVRIVRTLGAEQMEGTRSRTNSDIWANKISYSISIPTDAVVFGTSIVADVELSPIRKGITLGKVDLRLMEATVKRIQSDSHDTRFDRNKSDEIEVAKVEMDFPEESRVVFADESTENPTMEDERYTFKASLPLPKSLKDCRQDVDNHNINITHKFKLMVNIHNPEGHISQLVCRLPVKIFISPNLPVDEENRVQFNPNQLSDAELNRQEAAPNAPPEYGRHQLDALYNDISAAGYMSHAPSGSNTPFRAQSRRGSSDNLQSLGALADAPEGQINSALLQSRLANLQTYGQTNSTRAGPSHSPSGPNTPHNGMDTDMPLRPTPPAQNGSYFPTNMTPSRTTPPRSPMRISRRGSTDLDPDQSIHQTDYDLGSLSRVPSYGAAVRAPGTMTPYHDGPPSYIEATSRPPSPLQRPSAAYMRSAPSGTSTPTSTGSQNTLRETTGPLTPMPGRPTETRMQRSSSLLDEEARLSMLRARGS